MAKKVSVTDRLKIVEIRSFNEYGFCVKDTIYDKSGRPQIVHRQMTVADFVTELAKFPSDAIISLSSEVEDWSSSGATASAEVTVRWERDETDEEYDARMLIIQRQQAAQQARTDAAAARAEKTRERVRKAELDQLKKLISKHGIPASDA